MFNALKESMFAGAAFVALVVIIGGGASFFSLPNEATQPAQAISGGACDKQANVTASGGGVNPGERPATKQEKDACIPMACYTTPEGGTKCGPKPALQATAGGGEGLMDAIGKLMEKMMGGGGGGGGGGDQGGGMGANIDYQYGKKPECSDFVSSSGTQPAEAGSSIFLSWRRTGGETEAVTITPAVGVATLESPVELKVPARSTTYTLMVSNRSGASTCTTRVFVGPKGSKITNEDDLAFIAQQKKISDAEDAAQGNDGSDSTTLTNPLCKKTGYGDLDLECERAKAAREAAAKAKAAAEGGTDTTTAGLLYGTSGPIIAQGAIEEGYIDPNAFTEDPNAFVVDDRFGVDEGENFKGVRGDGDLASIEAQMRALNQNRGGSAVPTNTSFNLWGRPDVGVTGSLGSFEEDVEGRQNTAGSGQSIFGRIGEWIKKSFCFWCVSARSQAAVLPWVNPSPATKKQDNSSVSCDPDIGEVQDAQTGSCRMKTDEERNAPLPKSDSEKKDGDKNKNDKNENTDTLTGKCKEENKLKMANVCNQGVQTPADAATKNKARAECVKQFENYTHKEAVLPYEYSDFDPKKTAKERGDQKVTCQTVAVAGNDCASKCKSKGYAAVPSALSKDAYKDYIKCTPSSNAGAGDIYVCRDKKDTKPSTQKPGDGKGGTPPPAGPASPTKDGGGGFMDSKMGQGLGQGLGAGMGSGLMEALGKMLGGGGKQGGQQGGGGQPPVDPCASYSAQYNPACNPNIPTTAPSCGTVEVTESSGSIWDSVRGLFVSDPAPAASTTNDALTVSPSVIYRGQSATLNWAVTGKGKITTVVTYTTRDSDNTLITGSLAPVDGASGSVDVTPDNATTYTLKATNEVGTVRCRPVRLSIRPKTAADEAREAGGVDGLDTVIANATGKLKVVCEPEEYALNSGEQPTVSWSGCPAGSTSTLGTSSEDGAFSTDGTANDGSVDVSPKRDATYVVRCRDQYNEELARASCRITVDDSGPQTSTPTTSKNKPSVDIFIDSEDEVVEYGESVRVEWRSKNVASCVIYGPGCKKYGRNSNKCFKEIGRSGFVIGNIYEASEFVAECRAADRRTVVSDEVRIEVDNGAVPASSAASSAASPSASQIPVPEYNEGASLDELLLGE